MADQPAEQPTGHTDAPAPFALAPHETVHAPGGVEIAAWRQGEGPAVLLIGGLGMPSIVWELCGLASGLVEAGFSVIRFNSRGMAPSSAPPAPYSVEQMAEDAVAVLNHFRVDRAAVVGYSMGCYITQVLLRTIPQRIGAAALLAGLQPTPVGRMVGEMELNLIERYGEVPPEVLVFEQMTTTLPPRMLQEPAAAAGWKDVLSQGDGGWASPDGFHGQLRASQAWITAGEPKPEHLADISVPTLVLAYEFDLFFPPDQCEAAASLITGAQFIRIPGAAHGGLFTGTDNGIDHIVEFCRHHAAEIRGDA